MGQWAGKWVGGRYYLDVLGQKVYIIEANRKGVPRSTKLHTHDEELAKAQYAQFLANPRTFTVSIPEPEGALAPVHITKERLTLYMESIRKTVLDHRKARRSYLTDWAGLRLDLRTVDRRALRVALASFEGGHKGRVESLNAFARFLVKEGDLPSWNPLVSNRETEQTRAERVAYTPEQLVSVFQKLPSQALKDLFLLRASTGMHHTEIEQLRKAELTDNMLPDKGVWLRLLPGPHEIRGVLQVMHKSRHRHRQSLTGPMLEAATRLMGKVPHRLDAWHYFSPIIPSNLRHTFATLAGQMGRMVEYEQEGGVAQARVAQALGHREGSTMLADRYDKLQIPPLIVLPLKWDVL